MRLQPVTDPNGIQWKWNCGWSPVHHKPWQKQYVLGWDEFNRKLGFDIGVDGEATSHGVLLSKVKSHGSEFGKRAFDQSWRRLGGVKMIHSWANGDEGYGSVTVVSTDGIHAIVIDVDSMRLEVMLDHLRPLPKGGGGGKTSNAKARELMSPEVKAARRELRSKGIKKPTEHEMNVTLDAIRIRQEEITNLFR